MRLPALKAAVVHGCVLRRNIIVATLPLRTIATTREPLLVLLQASPWNGTGPRSKAHDPGPSLRSQDSATPKKVRAAERSLTLSRLCAVQPDSEIAGGPCSLPLAP